jgi:ribonuclease Y
MYISTGQIQKARIFLAGHEQLMDPQNVKLKKAWLATLERNYDKAIQITQLLAEGTVDDELIYTKNLQLGLLYRTINDNATARRYFEVERDTLLKKIKESEYTIQNTADEKAKEILVDAMQKSATDYVAETTATTIEIENEDLKGKIIGKEGRNIRTFEKLTGVDIIVDEAPNQVSLSCFDPIRREVAALALQKLLKDGRVHPGSIEDTIKNIKVDIAKEIKRTGEKMAFDTGFSGLPPEIIKLLGRFKYRFSYGQNLVKHTLEMIMIGEQLAVELGANVVLTKKASSAS